MSKTKTTPINPEVAHYMQPVPISFVKPFNTGLTSAGEKFMRAKLGDPKLPLSHNDCLNDHASDIVKKSLKTIKINNHLSITGITEAVESVERVLRKAFAQQKLAPESHDLESVLRSPGMICVRLRNVTSGPPSNAISNHSWGTAIDFNILGNEPPKDTGKFVPRFIAVLIPLFNQEGWFSGAGFSKSMDSMHFEVSEEELNKWFPKSGSAAVGASA